MGELLVETLQKRRDMNGQSVHEKIINIDHRRNVN